MKSSREKGWGVAAQLRNLSVGEKLFLAKIEQSNASSMTRYAKEKTGFIFRTSGCAGGTMVERIS